MIFPAAFPQLARYRRLVLVYRTIPDKSPGVQTPCGDISALKRSITFHMEPTAQLHRIPEHLFPAFTEAAPVTLLLSGGEALAERLAGPLDRRIVCLEVDALPVNCEALPDPITEPDAPIPGIDYRLTDPGRDFPTLYHLAQLAPRFPVRARIPIGPGSEKALTLAVALLLDVLLEPGQPTAEGVEQLGRCLDLYLRGPATESPVDPFHSLLVAALHEEPVDLWQIFEADPRTTVELAGDGVRRAPAPLDGIAQDDLASFLDRFPGGAHDHPECRSCPHLAGCRGFFKWPDPGYRCGPLIEQVLNPLQAAADSLRQLLGSQS